MRITKNEKIANLVNSITVSRGQLQMHAHGSKYWHLWQSRELECVIDLYNLGIVLPEIKSNYDLVCREARYHSDRFLELHNLEKKRA